MTVIVMTGEVGDKSIAEVVDKWEFVADVMLYNH